jgi:sulfoxide reductase catalytic subunit YedY
MSTYRTLRVPASEITPNSIWLRRRELLATGAEATFFLLAPSLASAMPLKAAKSTYTVADKLTPKQDVTSYNNFYECGVGKSDPSEYSGDFKPLPWAIKVDGMVGKPCAFDFDQIMKAFSPEERVYLSGFLNEATPALERLQ